MDVSNGPDHPSSQAYAHPCAWDVDLGAPTLPELLERAAARTPRAAAVDFLGRTYSYAEILDEARRVAAGLALRGIGKGDRVGLFLPNVPIYLSAYYGAMMAGATVVNFSPLYSAEELSAQVADSGTRLLVTVNVASLLPTASKVLDGSQLETLVVGSLGAMLPWPKRIALKLLGRKSIAAIPERADVVRWRHMLSSETAALPRVARDDLALLQYTGGTTGRPKGAMLTHANLATNALQVDAIDPERDTRDVILGVLPLFHVFANTCVLNRTVARGGCIAMLPRFDAKQALKALERVRATAFPGVPTMYQALLDHPQLAKTDFSSLRVCISGGAPLPAPVRERWEAETKSRLVEGYGLTESSGVVSTNPYEGLRKPGTIGQVLPHTRIRLLDKEDATRPAPDGQPGELVVAGPQVMQGYWNRPDAAADAFAEIDGTRWLRTGDVAEIDADGFIAIVDRIKDMIAVGGFKVFPSQVEAVLLEHPAVKEALVIGLPDDYHGEMPRAYVTLAEDAAATGDDLAKWLNTRVGKHERVSAVVVRDDLPKTMIGKLDRKALKAEVA
ncbi:long-chain-fatty-acid--CoA ligase [Tsuneonella amylolytica]|uniref:long-chain-fatty-acid--CoA ligase n=1 Tax=Tsuneonella amylolytica TaxID=2338327 RepID=UPI000EA9084F|nr:long-chain fatty acid--CoA ligase [Tsuneonella amylolytica]